MQSLTASQKTRAIAYALRSGADLDEARTLARAGNLTQDGRQKFAGGAAPDRGERRKVVEATSEEIAAFNKRTRDARFVSLAKDPLGFFIMGSGRRSSSYPTVGKIPVSVIRDLAG